MQDIILSPISFEQLKTAISEAVRNELNQFKDFEPAKHPEFITRKETAQILGISQVTLHEWTKSGKVKGYRIGSRVRYNREEVFQSFNRINTGRA